LIDQFANREACSAGPGDDVGGNLLELPLPFVSGAVNFLVANERAGSLVRFEQAIVLEFAVGADDSVGIDLEIDR